MKAKRLLFLVMAICLTSGVKAQFHDGPDEIYYYISDVFPNTYNVKSRRVCIFNFDGNKACCWVVESTADYLIKAMKERLKNNPNYYEEAIETADYDDVEFVTSYPQTQYKRYYRGKIIANFYFSSNREEMTEKSDNRVLNYKRVDKNYFKYGRSRTSSGTMYE